MSGVLGIVGDTSNLNNFHKIVNTLAHRGINGIFESTDKIFSVAQYLTKNSPYSNIKKSDLYLDKITILCDCRIDNRLELISKLDLKSDQISDITLIRLAYKRWNQKFVSFINGDFAIVIIDLNINKVFLFRDHLGIRPLYYSTHFGGLVFSSEIETFNKLVDGNLPINEEKLHSYLTVMNDLRIYSCETIYENIYSVHPASFIEFEIKNQIIKDYFYWEPNLNKYRILSTKEEFANEFKILFEKSISNRIYSDFEIGAHLSGGLDSSSVCVVARNILKSKKEKLNTYHFLTNRKETSEQYFAEKIIETGGIDNNFIKPSSNFIESLDFFHKNIKIPDWGILPYSMYGLEVAKNIQKKGIRTLLTGHDGDTVVGDGMEYIFDLIPQHKISEFKKHILTYAHSIDLTTIFDEWKIWTSEKKVRIIGISIFKNTIKNLLLKKKVWEVIILFIQFYKNNLFSILDLLKDLIKYIFKNKDLGTINFLKIGLLSKNIEQNKIKISQNIKLPTTLLPKELYHFKKIFSCGMIEVNEMMNVIGAKYGYDVCHPFLDKDLIELCITVPDEIKYNNGTGRGPLRLAMKDFLPKVIQERTTKVEFSPIIKANLLSAKPDLSKFFSDFTEKAQYYLLNEFKILGLNKKYSLKKVFQIQRLVVYYSWKNNKNL